jgi:hypothetical protein
MTTTKEWQELKKAQGGAFTPDQRAILFGEFPREQFSRDSELVKRYVAGEYLSKADKRDAKRLWLSGLRP